MKKYLSVMLAFLLAVCMLACKEPETGKPVIDEPVKTEAQAAENTEAAGDKDQQSAVKTEPAGEPEETGKTIERLIVGTTAQIEQAKMGEYGYEMLASGVTHPPLVYQDTEGAFHPLTVSWETEDAVTWTYTVLEGMTWEDGQPLSAADILFTLQYEDANGSANLVDQTDSEGKTTKAKYTDYKLSEDGRSISLTLAAPNVRELGNMTSFRVLPKHLYEGKETLSDDELRFGYGPYRFVSFNRDAGTITFEANEQYPAEPHVKELVFRLFNNDDTMLLSLMQQDIDMIWVYSTGIAASYQDALAEEDAVQMISVTAQNAPAVLAFNNAKGPFADENLRHAVAYMLDYEQLRDKVGSGLAQIPNTGFVPTSTVGYTETDKLKTDAGKAEAYMNAAGFAKDENGKYRDEDGNVFGFTLTYRADRNNQAACAELIKTSVEGCGGEVTLEPLDADSYNAKTSNKFSENNITMEAALYGYTSAGMGMGNGLATIYIDGRHAVQGGAQVYDEQFQSILAAMSEAKNLEEYTAAAADMQAFYADQLPVIALYWDSLTYGASAKLENITVDNVFGLNNVNNWLTITGK